MSEHLDALEQARLAEAEETIRTGIAAITRAGETLGRALWEIRDDRLYRASHTSFERYARDRWNLTARHANRLIHFAQVNAVLGPIGPAGTESQARELAPLLDRPPVMRQVWAKVSRRGKPTAKTIRAAVQQTTQTPADGPTPPGPAGGGSPAMRGEAHAGDSPIQTPDGTGAAGDARSPEGRPPAIGSAGEGDGPAGGLAGRPVSGASDASPVARPGAPTDPRPKPKPASPHDAGPESGGADAPSSSSQVDGAPGASPSARPAADGGAPWVEPVLMPAEVHAALTDPDFALYLPDFGCRLAMVHVNEGLSKDWAVLRAFRQSLAVA